jgi:hypothetical protein
MKFTNDMIERIFDKVQELITLHNENWDDIRALKKRVAALEKAESDRQAHEVTK